MPRVGINGIARQRHEPQIAREHSAGRVCEQSVPPGFWQHHNSNVSGLTRSRSLNTLQPLQACSSETCSSSRVRAESPLLPGRFYEC